MVFFVALSGLLAYWGDVIGRKLGKKRLTVGRLRPRHTAAIMTALFGMIGAALAISALLLLSQPVAKMLFEGSKVEKHLRELQDEQKKLRGQIAQEKGKVESERTKVKKETAKLVLAQKDVKGLRDFAARLKTETSRVKSQLAGVRTQLGTIKLQVAKLRADKQKIDVQLGYSTDELAITQRQNLKLLNQNLKLEKEIKTKEAEAKIRIEELQEDIRGLNVSLGELKKEYEEQSKKHRAEFEGLTKQINEAGQLLSEAKQDLAAVRAEAGKLNVVTRTQPLIFNREDELARIPVRNRLNASEAKGYVLALIEQASGHAKANGASASVGSGMFAALPSLQDNQGNTLTEAEQIQTLVAKLSGTNQEQVMIGSALFNAFQGEPVALKVRIVDNPVVYRQGQTILEGRFDGQASQDQVLNAITQFVTDQLAPKAIKDGLIPARGRPQPLGEIKQEDLLNLVGQIKSRPFISRVRFAAAQETRAGDRLKLEFKFP